MKANPTLADPAKVRLNRDELSHLAHATALDAQDMSKWQTSRRHGYKRRYGEVNREGVKYPWVGASNFNMPMSTIKIDELKGPLLNIALPQRMMYRFVASDDRSMANAARAARVFDWMLRYRMTDWGTPDLEPQTHHRLDSLLQHGVSFDKQFYRYRSIPRVFTVRRGDMPEALQRIQIVEDIDPQQQQMLADQAGVFAFTREQYDRVALPEVRSLLIYHYGLDTDEPDDAATLKKLITLHRSSNPDAKQTVSTRLVIDDCAATSNVPIGDIIIPHGVSNLQAATRVTHDLWMPQEELERNVNDMGWDAGAVDAMIDRGPTRLRESLNDGHTEIHSAMRDRTHTQQVQEGLLYRVSETYFYKEVDGLPVLSVQHWDRRTSDIGQKPVLRSQQYPGAHCTIPIVASRTEFNDHDVHSSRGVPDMIRDLEQHLTQLARAELNGLSLQAMPIYEYAQNGGFNPQKHRMAPGMTIPVRRPGSLRQVVQSPTSLALEQPMRNFMGLTDRVTGSFLSGSISGANAGRERVTQAEIGAVNSRDVATIAMRARAILVGNVTIARQLWSDWQQYGPSSFYAQSATEPTEKMTQHQIAGRYSIVPTVGVGDMDPQARAQQLLSVLQLIMQVGPQIDQDARYTSDTPAVLKAYLDELSPEFSARFMPRLTEEQSQQKMQMLQARAQEAQVISQQGQAMIEGAPVDPEMAAELIRQIERLSPHKGLQTVVSQAGQTRQSAEKAQLLASIQGAA